MKGDFTINGLRGYQEELINQLYDAWDSGYKAPCIVLPCGGGKSIIIAEIAKRFTLEHRHVLFLVHRKELCQQITDTFTSWGVNMEYCQICMVQTICRRLNGISKPSLIITDENHHSKASSYRKIYDYFPDVRRVGVTATPVRLDGSGLKDVNDKLILGVTAKWLIDNKNLAPFDYYAPPIQKQSPKFHVRNGEFVTSEILAFYDKSEIYGDIVKHYKKLADGKQAIAYCAAISQSEKLCKEFNENGITASHIDAKTPKNQRADIIERFRKGEVKILSNVDLISEGFDVPDCEVSILARPTKSLTLYIQQAMRCMRYKVGKRAIIIDHTDNWNRFGLPDEDREWTLDGEQKKASKGEAPVKTCPDCFGVVPASVKLCTHCGHEFVTKAKNEHKETQLIKVTEKMMLERRVRNYLSPADCKNMSELQEYARQKGYKPGWAYYQAKARGLLYNAKNRNSDSKRYPCKAIRGWDSYQK